MGECVTESCLGLDGDHLKYSVGSGLNISLLGASTNVSVATGDNQGRKASGDLVSGRAPGDFVERDSWGRAHFLYLSGVLR